mmetsp:Transcript_23789/g.68067  ORF Transcript_23789/g.68067 Transcript_23789/m.68067 type:complete len:255 (+) Transcript_23789:1225-1989(+)
MVVRRVSEALVQNERRVQVLQKLLDVPLHPALALVERLRDARATEAPRKGHASGAHEGGPPAEAVHRCPRHGVLADAAVHEAVGVLQCGDEEGGVGAPEVDHAQGVQCWRCDAPVVLVGLVHWVIRAEDALHIGARLRAHHEACAPVRLPAAIAELEHRRQQQLKHVLLWRHVRVQHHHEAHVLLHDVPQGILEVARLQEGVRALHTSNEPHERQPLCTELNHGGAARGHFRPVPRALAGQNHAASPYHATVPV